MQTPSASDPSFKAFLDKLQEQNNRGFASQLVQLKAERENAGEDNDKREEQLDEVILSLKQVRDAVTGIKIDIDLTPLVNIGENQTKLLEELSKESSLTRKLTEGSVEYDKEAAQYRNTSGRDIESKVSGKTSKDGGFLDFETARDTLSGQGKRVREDNAFSLKPISYTPGKAAAAAVGGKGKKSADEEEDLNQPAFKGFLEEIKSGFKFFMTDGLSEKPGTGIFQTPSKEVEKKDREADISSPRQVNPEADNVASAGEIEADAAKSDLELSKQMLDTTKAQLVELKAIREALAPSTPRELTEQKSAPSSTNEKESGGGGSLLGDLASGAMDLMGGGKKAAGKVAGKAASIGGKLAKFATSNTGKVLGSVAAVGLGAYTAYEGYTAAEDSKQAKMEDVQAKVDSGEMKPEEAAAARKEIGNTATVEKSGAIGEGTGMAAGAIAGASLGATIGSIVPGVGTAIGGLAGGAIGAFAGSKAGKFVGEKVGSGINTVKGFFGGSTDTPGTATKEALGGTPESDYEAEANKIAKEELKNGAEPANLEAIVFEKLQEKFPKVDRDILEFQADIAATKAKSNKNETPAASKPVVEKKPADTATGTLPDEKGFLAKTADTAKSIGSSVAGFFGFGGKADAPGKVTPKETVDGRPANATVIGDVRGGLTEDQFKYATSMQSGKYKNSITDKDGKEIEGDVARIKAMREGRDATNTTLSSSFETNPTPSTSAVVTPTKAAPVGTDVSKTSTENADMGREAGKGGANNTVVSNNVSSNNTTKIVPMKANPRPEYTGSSLDRYTNRITVY
jgi:hypothetical protein